jgi:hypothetical protein
MQCALYGTVVVIIYSGDRLVVAKTLAGNDHGRTLNVISFRDSLRGVDALDNGLRGRYYRGTSH